MSGSTVQMQWREFVELLRKTQEMQGQKAAAELLKIHAHDVLKEILSWGRTPGVAAVEPIPDADKFRGVVDLAEAVAVLREAFKPNRSYCPELEMRLRAVSRREALQIANDREPLAHAAELAGFEMHTGQVLAPFYVVEDGAMHPVMLEVTAWQRRRMDAAYEIARLEMVSHLSLCQAFSLVQRENGRRALVDPPEELLNTPEEMEAYLLALPIPALQVSDPDVRDESTDTKTESEL